MTAVRVLVVDDSPFVCRLLVGMLQSAPEIRIVGTAHNGQRALELVRSLQPNVVTLDLEMPGITGLAVLEEIMCASPTPVIVVSGVSRRAAETTLKALQCGAVDYVLKYSPGQDTDPDQLRDDLIAKVRQAARVRVIRSLSHRDHEPSPRPRAIPRVKAEAKTPRQTEFPGPAAGVVVIGASTGGPAAILELLERLPADFPAAILIVQHMPAAFTRVLADQFDRQVELSVKEAEPGVLLRAGLALVAPGDRHLLISPTGSVRLDDGPKMGGHRPAIDITMRSAAEVYGPRSHAVVLTGMGEDGASGLEMIRCKGGKTFAQDSPSCVINGMPQQAIDRGFVEFVGPPADIAAQLCKVLKAKILAVPAPVGVFEETLS